MLGLVVKSLDELAALGEIRDMLVLGETILGLGFPAYTFDGLGMEEYADLLVALLLTSDATLTGSLANREVDVVPAYLYCVDSFLEEGDEVLPAMTALVNLGEVSHAGALIANLGYFAEADKTLPEDGLTYSHVQPLGTSSASLAKSAGSRPACNAHFAAASSPRNVLTIT